MVAKFRWINTFILGYAMEGRTEYRQFYISLSFLQNRIIPSCVFINNYFKQKL